MGKDGALLGERQQFGGLVDIATIVKIFVGVELNPLTFPGRFEADQEARRHGWECIDSDGIANHRCPECIADQPRTGRSEQVGAYIEWPL